VPQLQPFGFDARSKVLDKIPTIVEDEIPTIVEDEIPTIVGDKKTFIVGDDVPSLVGGNGVMNGRDANPWPWQVSFQVLLHGLHTQLLSFIQSKMFLCFY